MPLYLRAICYSELRPYQRHTLHPAPRIAHQFQPCAICLQSHCTLSAGAATVASIPLEHVNPSMRYGGARRPAPLGANPSNAPNAPLHTLPPLPPLTLSLLPLYIYSVIFFFISRERVAAAPQALSARGVIARGRLGPGGPPCVIEPLTRHRTTQPAGHGIEPHITHKPRT
jgi:hypothetical protein